MAREDLISRLRSAGLAEAEALRAVEKWKDERQDADCLLWHLAHYKDSHVRNPISWLRGGLKDDYRPGAATDWDQERQLERAERALDKVRKGRLHDGSDSLPVGQLLDAVIDKYRPKG